MVDTILVKDVEVIYPEWSKGECKLFDGLSEVDKVVSREDNGGHSYIIWWVGGQWRHAFGIDRLRVQWMTQQQQPASAETSAGDGDAEMVAIIADDPDKFGELFSTEPDTRALNVLLEALRLRKAQLEGVGERIADLQAELAATRQRAAVAEAALKDAQFILEPMRETYHRFDGQDESYDFLDYMNRECDSDGVLHNYMAADKWLSERAAGSQPSAGEGE